jgi:hypothetical protein
MRAKALLKSRSASDRAQVRAPRTIEDVLLERVLEYDWWAVTYGYTPRQVDDLPMWFRDRAHVVRSIRAEIEAEEQQARG